mmetsp:Transcript_54696/g.124576  ORF Transcript_54696/g.124576 Transcript_54696/m.124576 type:complete len:95 (+) Transcript_54696:583-867(+)
MKDPMAKQVQAPAIQTPTREAAPVRAYKNGERRTTEVPKRDLPRVGEGPPGGNMDSSVLKLLILIAGKDGVGIMTTDNQGQSRRDQCAWRDHGG